MLKLRIEEYWNKVIPDRTCQLGTRVLPEFVLKRSVVYKDSGWQSMEEWKNAIKNRPGFLGFESGKAKFNTGRYYGISSYQLVSLEH